ncbi:DUF3043 domain-containing protein [Corynebacterium sp. 153RC1]|uniref:DUF3043 domain-containing protein n=1 Tax=unclassified Corynebacterium TaxID=2624378 RepID=UPI00211C8A94|nr:MULTISPECIES: DUF3043 domain-containing protein [unclassified Corynebacterium]MCQ9369836.1 DUF3043 domain-containing protein [Corynebacterium sp. 35RC1]MCQ9352281.1 DUF3043 domain-containing protein [Corynebacterium sp. 209RC1]MCQ9354329.1 DUF3043 domain-containing protein [Corynebacterium sp. 1222RC1]MCQ9356611.1 DUF3043 domain-containing protein [Corynebacterium sp. 122RC1]MCQ9359621.1 DUF3043 domain-containing protein [Corynebacterium sp. 142RC1]
MNERADNERGKSVSQTSSDSSTSGNSQETSKAYTPKKGKATPSRKQAQAQPGTFESRFSPGESYGDVRKRRKELKASMSSEQWKEYKRAEKERRRSKQREAQAAMDRGEEQYLLPRDKGPERAFIRDFVDSRRYLNNMVMPVAMGLLIVMLIGQWAPTFASVVSMVAMGLILLFFIEGIILGRRAAAATRQKFPNTQEKGFAMGFYAYGRATQPRRWRTPKPRVNLGDEVS